MEQFVTVLIWAAIIQGLLLSILFLTSKKHRRQSNTWLGLFLLSIIVEATSTFIPLDHILGYSINDYFTIPEVKLFFPLLFLHFVLEKVGRVKAYQHYLQLHYVLAFIIMGVTLVNIFLHVFYSQNLRNIIGDSGIELLFMSQQTYAFFLSILTFIISVKETKGYQKIATEDYSDMKMLEISWLWQFIFAILPLAVLWGLELSLIFIGGHGSWNVVIATYGLFVVFIYFVSFKAFKHQNLFEEKQLILNEKAQLQSEHESWNKDQAVNLDISAQLKESMENQHLYLQDDLTIYDLSNKINIPKRQISQCINQHFGVNFSTWVNNYRVQQAIEKFQQPKYNHLTIEGIGQESGFKSRSAMYLAFKKCKGKSPGEFRTSSLS